MTTAAFTYEANPGRVVFGIGSLACVYHLSNGIFTFSVTWGLASGPNAQRLVSRACNVLFAVLAFACVSILIAFRAPA